MGARVDLSACRACHCLAARQHARAITRLFEEKLRPHGLRATQFSVLAALALIGALLERNGWVSAARSEDARERPFRLTGAGRRKVEGAFPAWKKAQDLVDRRLTDPVMG